MKQVLEKSISEFLYNLGVEEIFPTMSQYPKVIKERTDHFGYIKIDNFHLAKYVKKGNGKLNKIFGI